VAAATAVHIESTSGIIGMSRATHGPIGAAAWVYSGAVPSSWHPRVTRTMMAETAANQSFRLERHGDVAVLIPSPEVESMHEHLIEQTAQIVLAPLKQDPPAGLVVDLSQVKFFGSVFISFLLRCHMPVKKRGSDMVLAGCSPAIKELLRLT